MHGCTEGAVRKAIAAKRITPNADATIDPERANPEWAKKRFARARRSTMPPGWRWHNRGRLRIQRSGQPTGAHQIPIGSPGRPAPPSLAGFGGGRRPHSPGRRSGMPAPPDQPPRFPGEPRFPPGCAAAVSPAAPWRWLVAASLCPGHCSRQRRSAPPPQSTSCLNAMGRLWASPKATVT